MIYGAQSCSKRLTADDSCITAAAPVRRLRQVARGCNAGASHLLMHCISSVSTQRRDTEISRAK
jgi:hypothetical protein